MQKVISEFIERNTNRQSLITVTGAKVSKDRKNLTILLTVFPESEEEKALSFLNRKRWEARDYLKQRLRTRVIPFISFKIDQGEKNRQRVHELLESEEN